MILHPTKQIGFYMPRSGQFVRLEIEELLMERGYHSPKCLTSCCFLHISKHT